MSIEVPGMAILQCIELPQAVQPVPVSSFHELSPSLGGLRNHFESFVILSATPHPYSFQ